jgi:hypothetical protein
VANAEARRRREKKSATWASPRNFSIQKELLMAKLLILGTYHFANPGLDAVQTQVADVLSEEKQREITAVLTTLATFKPS